jgi:peptide/nickel transport system permease protein
MTTLETTQNKQPSLKSKFPSNTINQILPLLLSIGRRLVFGIVVLLVIAYLSFFGLEMARGTAFNAALLGGVEKTVTYLGRLVHGDLGLTVAGSVTLRPVPITEVVGATVVRSLGLLLAALVIAAPIGVVLGIWASRRRHSNWPLLVLLASITGVSLPSFFVALLLQLAVIKLTSFTGKPLLPVGGFGWDSHILLPALVLAARPLAQISRVTFVTLNEVLDQDYVRTAYSKGLTARLVMNRHVIRNAMVPILTTLGVSLRFSLSSLPVVEYFFGWQGAGFTLLKAISRQDDNLTVALILCLGILFILVNLFLDLAYRLIDPRLGSAQENVRRTERMGVWQRIKTLLADLKALSVENPVARWLKSRKAPKAESPFASFLEDRDETQQSYADRRAGDRKALFKGTLGNLPFVMGGLLVLGLLVVIFFGPNLAPHSPYTTQGLTVIDGEMKVPPFEPDAAYPLGTDVLGRDVLSLILAGAQQTIFLAAVVVLSRMVIGFILGAIAGWWSGTWIDRTLLGAAEVIAAFPTLLLGMTLILALGIREGLPPFIIALSFVGWGEIMQFVRGEVMGIRPRLFIESAVAVGLRTPRILFKHVLPNLIPAMISILALEMGAVLMLLGELGFIGIFIGGGAFAELDVFGAPYHYSDVPEWGALLSNVRTYARAYPWMAIYPSLAFFIAILGFNLFGEGIRRMIEIVGTAISRIFNRYTLILAAVSTVAFIGIRGTTGAMAYYQQQAQAFDGQHAMTYLRDLTDPVLEGRALGSSGLDLAAEYIARQFQQMDIQAAGEKMSYFQPRPRSFESLDMVPVFEIEDAGSKPIYHQDFVEYPTYYYNLGAAHAQVQLLALGELTRVGNWFQNFPALDSLDFSDRVLMFLSEKDFAALRGVPRAGVLVVSQDPLDLKRNFTSSSARPSWGSWTGGRHTDWDAPVLSISEGLANRILAGTGKTVAELRSAAENLGQDEIFQHPTDTVVSMQVEGTLREKNTALHVIGHLPGTSAALDNKMIVVLAKYDSPAASPDGLLYPAANDNASGVALMLETIRTMRKVGYQPYKTFLFVAYSGEGWENGEPVVPEISKFLQTKYGFDNAFDVEAVIELRGMANQDGERLQLMAGGSVRLADLFQTAARRMHVPVDRSGENVDLSIVFEDRSLQQGGEEAPSIRLDWQGWQNSSHSSLDTVDSISVDNLQDAGRALNLALMVLGRETQY